MKKPKQPYSFSFKASMSTKRLSNSAKPGKSAKKEKRCETAIINSDLDNDAIRNGIKDAWKNRTSFFQGSVHLACEPFPHCKIDHFLQNERFAESLRDELLQLNFHRKSNDLYKFQQSDDLKNRKDHHISEIRSLIFEQFRSWLGELLEVDLEPTVDISCAKYEHTDVLLCHDDELEGRRVAFIFYLLPSWDMSDGGTLDLFSTDEHYQPVSVIKSLVPCWNTLMFFEVSPVSFHQVSEVLAEDKCRLSLSGWFHGPSLPRPPRYIEPLIPRHTHIPRNEDILFEWVNETYMDPLYQAQVQQEFENSSEIRLPNFLVEDKFKQVSKALQLTELQWERKGPPNKRSYTSAKLESLPSCLKECWELLSSEPFFLLLSNLTGLSLHYLAAKDEDSETESHCEESDAEKGEGKRNDTDGQSTSTVSSLTTENNKGPPMCVGELQCWTHGDYTLLHDSVKREFALDLLLHLNCRGWNVEVGGFTSYIAHDEDDELLTVYPEENSLALVYRDMETLKFIKHINHSSVSKDPDQKDTAFYDFSFTYYE
ncbi:prolyl 3-hydroxylase OGFOD1 [Trichomycterus rosablanca]|uniref:prolyl 3-hydroxylase OGFOD1 n=1 Tax=Trichomycterus rosablanca TaxID=2290929 RepID=UPI002F35B2EE